MMLSMFLVVICTTSIVDLQCIFYPSSAARGYGVTISRKPMGYFFHIARTYPIGSVDVPFGDHDI